MTSSTCGICAMGFYLPEKEVPLAELAEKAGLETWPVFEFSRTAKQPDGSTPTVSFGLNFVTHKEMPLAAFFSCQQFAPQYFWKPEYQMHNNTAGKVIEVAIVAENPQKYEQFFSDFMHCSVAKSTMQEVVVQSRRGRVAVLAPDLYEQRYRSAAPDMKMGPQISGCLIGVAEQSEVLQKPVCLSGLTIGFEQIEPKPA